MVIRQKMFPDHVNKDITKIGEMFCRYKKIKKLKFSLGVDRCYVVLLSIFDNIRL